MLVVVAMGSPQPAEACGPGFTVDRLLDRHRTLTSLPEGIFAHEVAQLVAPPPLPADEAEAAAARFDLGERARMLLDSGDDAGAVRLYAAQAAHGSSSGRASLVLVVRAVVKDATRTSALMNDDVGRHLLASYLYTRPGELTDERRDALYRQLLEQLRVESTTLRGASRLAAVAYAHGDWEHAASLARHEVTPLSTWVLAKLALRLGERQKAEALLDEVRSALDRSGACPDDAWHRWLHARIDAERASLQVAERRYVDALEVLARSERLTDGGLYLAERVLTVDELMAFVQERPSATAVDKVLRDVLARRLLREERFEDALRWSPPPRRRLVRELVDAYAADRRALADDEAIDAARHRLRASTLLREHGLELIGTVGAPDWARLDGDFAPHIDPSEHLSQHPHWQSDDEKRRSGMHAPVPNDRWHYRKVASALAEEAASLVPERSQAYAALLCHAALRVDEATKQRLWKRYVDRGAVVSFTATFGERCPAPVFDRAKDLAEALEREQRRQPWPVAALLALLPIVLVVARRRRTEPPVTPL